MNNSAIIQSKELAQCNSVISSTVIECFSSFLDVSFVTLRAYRSGIKHFITFINSQNITQPNRDTVIMFKKTLQLNGAKTSTVAMYLSAIRRFFSWTESEGLYPNITAGVKSPKQDKGHKKDALSGGQIKSCLEGIDRATVQCKRDYAMFLLMSVCGLRTCEVARANVEDIRQVQGVDCLFVQGKGRSDKKEFVKLCPEVAGAIRDYLNARGPVEDSAPLFASCSRRNRGGRLTTRTVSGVCKTAMKAAGYDSHRLTAHSLRHTAVTLALLAGQSLEDVQHFARHSSITTTTIYSHAVNRLKSQCENAIAGAIFAA